MNISFWGNSNFSKLVLEDLIKNNFIPNLVITFSPKEFGRLKELKQNPVEEIAKENNIEIIYFDNFEEQELRDTLKSKKVNVGIVASFGKIIPKTILRVFPFGLINIHPSLLPKYRGSTPIQSAIIEGDITTGTTIFIIDEEMDHGPIIGQISTEISIEDTYKTLEEKLALLGSKLIINLLPNYLNKEIAIKPQEEDLATYTKKFFFKNCHLVWNQPSIKIYNFVRALNNEPGVFSYFQKDSKNILLKINKIDLVTDLNILEELNQKYSSLSWGAVIQYEKRFFIKTLDGFIEIITVQPDGKKPMPFSDFYNGNQITELI